MDCSRKYRRCRQYGLSFTTLTDWRWLLFLFDWLKLIVLDLSSELGQFQVCYALQLLFLLQLRLKLLYLLLLVF